MKNQTLGLILFTICLVAGAVLKKPKCENKKETKFIPVVVESECLDDYEGLKVVKE